MDREKLNVLEALVTGLSGCPWLECDGFARILHTYLVREGIDHETHYGSVAYDPGKISLAGQVEVIEPHFWTKIFLPDEAEIIADSNLRRFFDGQTIPHGLFRVRDHPELFYYSNKILELPELNGGVIQAMLQDPSEHLSKLKAAISGNPNKNEYHLDKIH